MKKQPTKNTREGKRQRSEGVKVQFGNIKEIEMDFGDWDQKCPVCGNQNFELTCSLQYGHRPEEGAFETFKCPDCGLDGISIFYVLAPVWVAWTDPEG